MDKKLSCSNIKNSSCLSATRPTAHVEEHPNMLEYQTVDLKKWKVFDDVDGDLLRHVDLVHVFGYDAERAYLVTSADEVFAVGDNVFGCLGIGEVLRTTAPIRLDILCGKSVKCFATGTIHTLALTDCGDVYSWGSNNFGQVGNGTATSQHTPYKIKFPVNEKIKQISCADRYSLALSEQNNMYHWGDIGWESSTEQTIPSLLELPSTIVFTYICCGAFHAAALTTKGKLYTWGTNHVGQLGNGKYGENETRDRPRKVKGQIEDQFIVKVTCSSLATVALTKEGNLYAWGHNKFSCLSVGFPAEVVCFPQRVIFRKNIVNIAANNLQAVLCAEAEDPKEIFLWAFEDRNEGLTLQKNCSTILDAFAGRAMPVVKRRITCAPSEELKTDVFQGPTRDIGKALFNIKDLSDLTIKLADGEEVYVHTLIMKTFSEHFRTALDKNWANGENSITMSQYNPKAYKAFLKYIYTGALDPLGGIEIIALCDIAVSYFEHDLKVLCKKMFDECLTVKNVAQFYSLAAGNHSELVQSCIKFTSEHVELVILSEGFQFLDPILSKELVVGAVRLKHSQ